MTVLFKNNVTATLAAGISSSVTSISVTAGQGVRFPSPSMGDFFYATLYDSSNNIEIIKVTSRATDVLTVVRGQDNTTARAYLTGDSIAIRVVAASLVDLVSYTPSGNIAATTLATAVTELDSEKAGLALNNTFTGNNTFSNNVTLTGGATGNLTGNVIGNASTASSAVVLSGTNPVANGGTGQTSLVLNSIPVGNGVFPVNGVAPGAAGNILTSAVYGSATFTAGISTGVLTVATGTLTGTLTENAVITGTGVTAGTTINQLTSAASAVATPTFVSGGGIGAFQLIVSTATGLVAGQLVTGTGVPANTFLQALNGTTLTLTRAFTVQAAGTYSFFTPGGVGTYQTTPSQTVSTGTAMTATNGTQWTSALPQSAYIKGQMFAPASFVGTVTGTTLTVTSMNYGFINKGNTVFGTGITGSPTISSQTSGTTGGAGVYVLSVSQGTLSSFTMNNGTGSGIFEVPALVSGLKITAAGGGGGGGGAGSNVYGGGSGGTGGTGGPTSFGSYMSVAGGLGGQGVTTYYGGGNVGATGVSGKSPQAYYGLSPNFINTDGSGGGYGTGGNGGFSSGWGCCDGNYGGKGGVSVTSVANITPPAAGTSITVTIGTGGTAGTNGPGTAGVSSAGNQGFCLVEW